MTNNISYEDFQKMTIKEKCSKLRKEFEKNNKKAEQIARSYGYTGKMPKMKFLCSKKDLEDMKIYEM